MEYLICTASARRHISDGSAYQAMLRYDGLMARHDLTGLTLLHDGAATYYLEGHPNDLTRICLWLHRDLLIEGLVIQRQGPLALRRCPRWQMAYATAQAPHHPAFSPLLSDLTTPWPAALAEAPELAALRDVRDGGLLVQAVGG